MTIATSVSDLATSITNFGNAVNTKKLGAVKGVAASINEVTKAITINSVATAIIDTSTASIFDLTLQQASSKITFTNIPQATNGAKWTFNIVLNVIHGIASSVIDWSGLTITWQDGVAPDQTATAGKKDVYILVTEDGGATFQGYTAGTNR